MSSKRFDDQTKIPWYIVFISGSGLPLCIFLNVKIICLEVRFRWDLFYPLDICSFKMPNRCIERDFFFYFEARLPSKQPVCFRIHYGHNWLVFTSWLLIDLEQEVFQTGLRIFKVWNCEVAIIFELSLCSCRKILETACPSYATKVAIGKFCWARKTEWQIFFRL